MLDMIGYYTHFTLYQSFSMSLSLVFDAIFFWGKKIFIVSKQKNRQKIQKIDIYNIHKLYTKKNK